VSESTNNKIIYQKKNESITRLNKKNTSKKPKNNSFKKILKDVILPNTNREYKRSKSKDSNRSNYNNSSRSNYNNSSRSKSNSSRGGRKP
jgi:hypothetical protein